MMLLFFRLFSLVFLFLYGCSTGENPERNDTITLKDVVTPKAPIMAEPLFHTKDRTEQEIIEDFPKPVRSYPTIGQDDTETHEGGVLYRKNIDRPFTGRLLEKYADGSISLEASYLDGLPHGQQLRYFKNGKPALEAIFDFGVLSGIKTRWWESGIVREEEYWSAGKFFGRRLWDEFGRMIREEMVSN